MQIAWRCANRLENGSAYCKRSPTVKELTLHTAIIRCINQHIETLDGNKPSSCHGVDTSGGKTYYVKSTLDEYDETVVRATIERIEISQNRKLTVYFRNGGIIREEPIEL